MWREGDVPFRANVVKVKDEEDVLLARVGMDGEEGLRGTLMVML